MKKSVQRAIIAMENLKKHLKTELLKKVHQHRSKKYVERVEAMIYQDRAILIPEMSPEEFKELCDLEDLQEILQSLHSLKG